MDEISMFDVLPVTGMSRESRFCLVCALGSAPVMVVFLQPHLVERESVVAEIEKISDENKRLQVIIVCLGDPDQLRPVLRRLADGWKWLTVPLTVLPDGRIPIRQVDPKDENTVVTYRGRRITDVQRNVDFEKFDPDEEGGDVSDALRDAEFGRLGASDFKSFNIAAPARRSPDLGTVRSAVADMMKGL